MKVLIVTGGIGSGKSLVCRLLKDKYGIPVYEADSRAKQLYTDCPFVLDEIEKAIGATVKNDEGVFVPSLLADVIFKDADALRKVEDILFPVLIRDFESWSSIQEAEVVAIESATVLEKQHFEGFGDIILLIDAPINVRLERAMSRDGASREKIIARMKAQPMMNELSDGAESIRVDYVLLNDSTEKELEAKLAEFIEKYVLTKML